MLIGGDDIRNDVITLGHVFFNVCLHSGSFPLRAYWRKSDSSVNDETRKLRLEFKVQRRCRKLSFLFPPGRQRASESLLAG